MTDSFDAPNDLQNLNQTVTMAEQNAYNEAKSYLQNNPKSSLTNDENRNWKIINISFVVIVIVIILLIIGFIIYRVTKK